MIPRAAQGTSSYPTVPITGEQMDVVIVGHVDHGKSTVIGRLMADTGSLPEGKLEAVKVSCLKSSRPFEYAFLLDALKSEQAQGITIDTARCFFKTEKRHYIIHDAPGHVEFLKNMVTGAARAEAALLVIDAHEGIQENSRRHGYILSMLGIRQVAILVNKMDLVNHNEMVFAEICDTYGEFLNQLGVSPQRFIPVSAREGDTIATRGEHMPWYEGPTVLEQVDSFTKLTAGAEKPFRMPVQDVYKFTAAGDDRRIVAGTIETGTLRVGDEVLFLPSEKRSAVKSIEGFNTGPIGEAVAGQATGFTLTTEIYTRSGELMVRSDERAPSVGTRFRVNIFWMARAPMILGKRYKLKLGSTRVAVELAEILTVLDASELSSIEDKQQIDRHDVGECILETARPVAFDLSGDLEKTARFVIVDDHEIAACGIVIEDARTDESLLRNRIRQREFNWDTGDITRELRIAGYGHSGKFIVFIAAASEDDRAGEVAGRLARLLERRLFATHKHTYYLAIGNLFTELTHLGMSEPLDREEHLLQLGGLARIMTDSGLLFITTLSGADDIDLEKLRLLNEPNEIFIVGVGETDLKTVAPHVTVALEIDPNDAVLSISRELNARNVIPDYAI